MSLRRTKALLVALGWCAAAASMAVGSRPDPVDNSDLDASTFYEILIGELQLRQGDLGGGYQQLLSAAKRSRDETLYRRAVEVALTAGSREQALAAAKAWRSAAPRSASANEFLGRLLLASQREADAMAPLRDWLSYSAASERATALSALPRGSLCPGRRCACSSGSPERADPPLCERQRRRRACRGVGDTRPCGQHRG